MLQIQIDWANRYFAVLDTEPPKATPRLVLRATLSGVTFTGENLMFQLPDNKTANLAVSATDAAGVPATLDGAATFASSDPTIVVVEAAADGLSATIKPAAPVKLGTAQIQVSADADLGAGVTTINGLVDVEIVAGQATSLVLTPTLNA